MRPDASLRKLARRRFLSPAPWQGSRDRSIIVPLFGFDMTVTTRIRYTLVDTHTNQVLLEEVIAAPHTATTGDAFVGTTRLRLANEGSAKKNIQNFLNRLAQLKIESNQVSLAQ